jgi:Transglutaminase-like superfamily
LFSSLPDRTRALAEVRGARELWLFARVGTFAAAVPLLMRLPLPRLAALLTRQPRCRRARTEEVERLVRLIALAPHVGRPLVRPGCLTRGVTLFWFLRRAGLNVELRFGLEAPNDGMADGHCWLSLDGEPFLEQVDPRPRFAELYRLPLTLA